MAGGHVGPVDGDEEGADPGGTGSRGTGRVLGFDQPAGTGVHDDSQPLAGVAGEAGVGQGHDRGRHRELAEAAHTAGGLAVDVVLGPEPFGPAHDLAASPAEPLRRRLQTRFAGQQPGPRRGGVAQGGDRPDSGDDDGASRRPRARPLPIHPSRHRTGVRRRTGPVAAGLAIRRTAASIARVVRVNRSPPPAGVGCGSRSGPARPAPVVPSRPRLSPPGCRPNPGRRTNGPRRRLRPDRRWSG